MGGGSTGSWPRCRRPSGSEPRNLHSARRSGRIPTSGDGPRRSAGAPGVLQDSDWGVSYRAADRSSSACDRLPPHTASAGDLPLLPVTHATVFPCSSGVLRRTLVPPSCRTTHVERGAWNASQVPLNLTLVALRARSTFPVHRAFHLLLESVESLIKDPA